jgi:hypothetical protein
MKNRKYSKTEKVIIAMCGDNYVTYDCPEHGVFQKRKDVDDGKCPYSTCKSTPVKIENIDELRKKFSEELGISQQPNINSMQISS